MAQHGYLREYDEAPDRDEDRDRDEWRERSEWRSRGDRDWRSGDRDWREASEHNRSFMFGGHDREPRRFRSNQDEHYRSWRDRQMEALDRDYEEYCREREQKFHEDFDAWRLNRRDRMQQPGMPTDQRDVSASEPVMDLTEPAVRPDGPDPTNEATLGTNDSSASRRR